VSTAYLTSLRGLPATLERLRIDCQLTEAMAAGFDPLHLAKVFGISEHTAIRYAVNARQLSGWAHRRHPEYRELGPRRDSRTVIGVRGRQPNGRGRRALPTSRARP
jgi:hypothetical protein